MGAVPQEPHQGIRLWGLYRLEAGERGDVPRLCTEAQQVFAVFVVHHLLLRDLLHLLSKALGTEKKHFQRQLNRRGHTQLTNSWTPHQGGCLARTELQTRSDIQVPHMK